MTSVQERSLELGGRRYRVGYWTGLFVDPDFRADFVYPQLMLAMLKGLRSEGILHLSAAVRRQQIAESHLKMGFKKIGDLAVLAKPLRPALLVAKYKGLLPRADSRPLVRGLCWGPDMLVRVAARLHCLLSGGVVESIPWGSPVVGQVAALHRLGRESALSQPWDVESLYARYGAKDVGYKLVAVRRRERVVGAAVVRLVERTDGIRSGIVMDIAHDPGLPASVSMALAAAETVALDGNCDVLLILDGLSATESRRVRRRGYLASPEKYSLLLWTDRSGDPQALPRDVRSWRFVFGDHDTF